jgi:4'-phosphopantetheinyl transferase
MLATARTQGAPSTARQRWRPGPARPRLADGAVHVWRADLTALGNELADLLSPAERARAQRMRRERDRQLWARGRGVLRALLGRYLASDARALRFTTEARGKPVLLGDGEDSAAGDSPPARATAARLSFNLSHSQGLALYALTEIGPIGVDVEVARRAIDEVALAARAFGPAEARRLQRLDAARRSQEFRRAWVRREAELKCRGTGIGVAVGGSGGPGPWTAELDVGPQAACAVALAGSPRELRCWDWQRPSRF